MRAGIVAAGLFPLVLVASAGIINLVALRSGAQASVIESLIATVLLGVIAMIWGLDPWFLIFAAGVVWALAIGLAMLLQRLGSLTLLVQLCLVVTVIGVVLVGAAIDDPVALWAPLLELMQAVLGGTGNMSEEEWAQAMFGFAAGAAFLSLAATVFIGRWAQSQLDQGISFSTEFRRLKMGYVLSGVAVLMMLLQLFTHWPWVVNVLAVFMSAYLIQGLAVVHTLVEFNGWHSGWLGLVYVVLLLPSPLAPLATIVLACLGYLDNWFRIRPPDN